MPGPESDSLWESGAATDYHDTSRTAVSRVRIGYPRLTQIETTNSDLATARAALTALGAGLPTYGNDGAPVSPETDDPLADVKRALAFRPSTGVSLISGARFASYLRSNSETRIADGAAIFNVVDQSFVPNPNVPTTTRPGLSYLRLGKPEPKLLDASNTPLTREADLLMDQKYGAGIGLYSDGGLSAWTRQPMRLRSDGNIHIDAANIRINGSFFGLTSYGPSTTATYEIDDENDINLINAGLTSDQSVKRKIINLNLLRNTSLGWYRQIFDRGKTLTFATANKGDFTTSSQYALNVGAKFEHTLSVGLSTEFSGKISASKSFLIDIGTGGATFKHPFGTWIKDMSYEVQADTSITIGLTGVDSVAMETPMKIYSGVLHAAIAVQMVAFLAYNSALADRADRPITSDDTADADGKYDDTHGLRDALDDGLKVYEAAIALSVITAAAGCIMAALQAGLSSMSCMIPAMTPTLKITALGIELSCGPSSLKIGYDGIEMSGAARIVTSAPTVSQMSPSISHLPAVVPRVPI